MTSFPRRALTNVGGKVQIELGNVDHQHLLRHALSVTSDDPDLRSHMHGFHAYPARLHPVTARRLITGLTRPGDCVMDPFCGSGTVLVEAQLEGRIAWGIDANPLAAMLAAFKLRNTQQAERAGLLASAKSVAQTAEERRIRKVGPSRRYPSSQASQFDPHVLLELDGLRSGIDRIEDPFCKEGLLLVLSAIANKVSRHTSDTALGPSKRRWASGYVIKFFYKKAEELTRRQAEFSQRLAANVKHVSDIRLGDAQELPFQDSRVTAIISSPPYPGIYDYAEHHRLRLQWLNLSSSYLRQHEIGARRNSTGGQADSFRKNYSTQLGRCLTEMVRVLRRDGTIALVVADTVIDKQAWYADEEIGPIAANAGLAVIAAASQERTHFHRPTGRAFGRRSRCERLLLLKRK
jgi:DNA modification methylase